LIHLLFFLLLLIEDQIQIPCWKGENFFCRLLLDYGIINSSIGIVDALFRNHSIFDTFRIICDHVNWRKNNIPQIKGEFIKYLETHIPEMFSFDMPDEYRDLLYVYFFRNPKKDYVHDCMHDFICKYFTDKLVSAIRGNDHERIRDIYRLFNEGNKDWNKWYGNEKENMEKLKILNSRTLENMENGENAAKFLERPLVSIYDTDYLQFLLIITSRDKECQHLEDIILKYIPLYMIDKVLSFSPFLEQNEDMYQNMIQKYPGLSRRDALLERLLPCFVTIAMRDIDSIVMGDIIDFIRGEQYVNIKDSFYLLLCVLYKLCEMKDTDLKSILLILEELYNFYKHLGFVDNELALHYEFAFDIVSKYPQIQKLLLEDSYKKINSLCYAPVFSFLSATSAAFIIGKYKGLWYGLKQLLIVFRTLKRELISELVDKDLNLKRGYNMINPFFIIGDYLCYFIKSSKELRQEMANGLSDWLKPLPNSKRDDLNKRLENYTSEEKEIEGFDINYIEPNPIWRYAYVRAIADLGVDVDGKGHYIHSIMDKVAQEDPSEMVREAAVKTSAELKNLRDGWDKGSHLKKIRLALWWFMQASRLAMNLPINRIKVLSARDKISRAFVGFEIKEEEKSVKDEGTQVREKLMRARFGI